jgi:hypothetical protein
VPLGNTKAVRLNDSKFPRIFPSVPPFVESYFDCSHFHKSHPDSESKKRENSGRKLAVPNEIVESMQLKRRKADLSKDSQDTMHISKELHNERVKYAQEHGKMAG